MRHVRAPLSTTWQAISPGTIAAVHNTQASRTRFVMYTAPKRGDPACRPFQMLVFHGHWPESGIGWSIILKRPRATGVPLTGPTIGAQTSPEKGHSSSVALKNLPRVGAFVPIAAGASAVRT
jgi:hypothetical protein